MEQWYNQIYLTTGHKALIYHGNKKKKCKKEDLENATIVITSYAHITLKKDKEKGITLFKNSTSLINDIAWNRVVFDEAHHLRNSGTGRNLGSRSLKADIIWLISGTPIQNTRKDFYHLCTTLRIPSFEPENIPGILERFILRRTKKSVGLFCGELSVVPHEVGWKKKKEVDISLDVHSYLSMNREFKERLIGAGKGFEEGYISPFENKRMLELYLRAKQSCILPSLIGRRLVGKDLWKSNYSSKIDAVVDCILSKKDNGNGKLIFCNYRMEMDILLRKLTDGGLSGVIIIDGRVTGAQRKKVLSELHLYNVLIIQIQTGCEGLNLQEYFSEIYFVSPNWNPCVEDQAVGRCYRLGQKKKVFVYKFVMMNDIVSDTVLEKVKDLERGLVEMIIDYIPMCNMKWVNMDEYIVSVQGMKREMIKEFIL
jgi:SNF2 family DNA or RNA helicase